MTQPPADQEGVSKEELEIWAKSINPACSKLSRFALALLAERDALKERAEEMELIQMMMVDAADHLMMGRAEEES